MLQPQTAFTGRKTTMYTRTILFLCLVLCLSTQAIPIRWFGRQPSKTRDPGQPCCLPTHESRASLLFGSVTDGTSKAFTSTASMAFDNDNFKAAAHEISTAEDPTANVSIIIDYMAGLIYIAQPKTQDCHTEFVPPGMEGTCIPDDIGQYLGKGTLGLAASSMPVDMWKIDGRMTGLDVQFQAMVTPDKCAPVQISMWGSGDDQFLTSITFFNLKPGIKDPNVFNVPSYCNSTPRRPRNHIKLSPLMLALKYQLKIMSYPRLVNRL